jgi:hypothetical protein
VTAVPFALDLPFLWILTSARHLRREVLQDHGLGIGELLSHIPLLLGSNLHRDLLSAVHWEALGDLGHRPGQVNLESRSVDIVEHIFVA